jgi:hypothetical protein
MPLTQPAAADDMHSRGAARVNDPIVDEVRAIREAYAASFGYDVDAIIADLRRSEDAHRERLVTLTPKTLEK